MSILSAALFAGIVAVAAAYDSSYYAPSSYYIAAASNSLPSYAVAFDAAPLVVEQCHYMPTVSSMYSHYSGSIHYFTYYSHHKEYIYTSSTCSSPPSSIEICLSSVFSSLEAELTIIRASLSKHEISIKGQMHHEHTLLSSEISWVYVVEEIAKSVKEAVSVDYTNLKKQVIALTLEKKQVYAAYEYVVEQLKYIFIEINEIEAQELSIYYEYQKIEKAKWSLYHYISAIVYEKSVVKQEVVEIQAVIYNLNIQINKISAKIGQLTKRQAWLSKYQSMLYKDIVSFHLNIQEFKSVQKDLKIEEKALVVEQQRLFAEATYAKAAIAKLKKEYVAIAAYLKELYAYELKIHQVYYYVKGEASVFISAYEEFTCEDSLLYYEACSSSVKAAAPALAAPKPAVKASPVAP